MDSSAPLYSLGNDATLFSLPTRRLFLAAGLLQFKRPKIFYGWWVVFACFSIIVYGWGPSSMGSVSFSTLFARSSAGLRLLQPWPSLSIALRRALALRW